MRIHVNGVRLYCDVEGSALVYREGRLVEQPTVVLLHGGPGYDHLSFKPYFSRLTDAAQIVYVDHRGHGRSEPGEPEEWTLRQWGDDVLALLDALGLERPVLLGHSFGGFLALEVALRAPDRLGKLILSSTGAWPNIDNATEAFRRLVGDEAAEAHDAMHRDPTIEHFIAYDQHCNPHYNTTPQEPGAARHMEMNMPLLAQWIAGEGQQFDYRERLETITCLTLVLTGDADPVTPVQESRAMAERIPGATLAVLPNCGHGVWRDDPDGAEQALRAFLAA